MFAAAKVRLVAHGRRVTFHDLFAYANTQAAIGEVRRAVEHQLEAEGSAGDAIVIWLQFA